MPKARSRFRVAASARAAANVSGWPMIGISFNSLRELSYGPSVSLAGTPFGFLNRRANDFDPVACTIKRRPGQAASGISRRWLVGRYLWIAASVSLVVGLDMIHRGKQGVH